MSLKFSDLSHEGLYEIFGDFLHEVPEVVPSIRHITYESRPSVTSGGFKIRLPNSSRSRLHARFGKRPE
jgi:hypothetical protein